MMRKLTLAGVFALASITAATAADLPRRDRAPVVTTVVEAPVSYDRTGFYVGAAGGYTFRDQTYSLAARAGFDFGNFRVEADVDHALRGPVKTVDVNGVLLEGRKAARTEVAGNLIVEHTFNRFTPYFLAGVGYRYNHDDLIVGRRDAYLYSVGGGVRYSLTSNWDLDARYRFVDTFNRSGDLDVRGENRFTLGVGYQF